MSIQENCVHYDEIKKDLKTGDLVLCHGVSFSSRLEELFGGSSWSHVGMVIKPEDIGITDIDKPLFWESNVLVNLEDVELKLGKKGPMLVDLHDRILTDVKNKLDLKFQIRYLEAGITREMLESLKAFIKRVHSDIFPLKESQMIIEFLEGRFLDEKSSKGEYFCSQLVADTYINMGLMTTKYPANSYSPKDFSGDGVVPLLKRARLIDGPHIDIG